ncbi:MAG TPA: tetratricopeptide repeat protein [Lutibacter sp.]|nr:tetratricopeptide repeat protein [Lutibacter sp.]
MRLLLNITILLVFNTFVSLGQSIDSLKQVVESNNLEGRIDALIVLGKKQLYTDTDQSEQYSLTALNEVRRIGKEKKESDILNQLGVIQYKRSQMDSALVFYKMSYSISERLKDTLQMAINHSNVANILRAQHKYDLAINSFLKALPIYEKKGKVLYQAMTYGAIGTLHLSTNEYKKALNYFNKTAKILEKLGNVQAVITTELNIAICYEHLQKRKEAKKLLEKLLVDTETHKLQRKHSIVLAKLAKIYFLDEDLSTAMSFYKKALNEFIKAKDIGGMAEAQLFLGKISLKQKDYEKSLAYFKKSYANVQKTGVDRKSPEAIQGIIQSLKMLNRNGEAISYFNMLLDAKDSVFNMERRKVATETDTKFNVAEKEREIITQKLELEKKDVKLAKQKQLGYALGSLAILLSILLFFVKRANKYKRLNEYNTIKKNKLELEQKVLRTQMNPHFIFNTLNSIQSYVSENDATNAELYLAKFSRLIRLILENSRKDFVLFEEDYTTLETYLSLEKVRFDDSFEYMINVPENFEEIKIPPMLIQAFVENAILHGISSLKEKGKIEINYKIITDLEDEDLLYGLIKCSIKDNGIGIKASKNKEKTGYTKHNSMSFSLINDRLKNYTKKTNIVYEVVIESNDNGTLVSVELPYIL